MDYQTQNLEPGGAPHSQQGGPASQEERTWGMACHLSALAGLIFPFGNIIGPLVVWLMKKDEYSFVDDQGKESLNFQLSLLIYSIVIALPSLFLLFLPLIALWGAGVVFAIIAGVAANEGRAYRYPLTLRLIK